MPIAITIAIVAILGIGSYLFISNSEAPTDTPTPAESSRPATEEATESSTDEPPTPDDLPPLPRDAVEESDEAEDAATEGSATSAAEPVTQEVTGVATYLTPNRQEHEVNVTFTVTDGVVADSEVIFDRSDGYSNSHQERFDAAYKEQVIGQPLENVSLSRVGGASLTSEAFNEAAASAAAKLEA
jgi:hypothetical protein